ncbi:hypothetical protein AB3M83_12750 [Microbacterium sp. 179-B 1A2 NHS]|uniref:hypothetical protein n=1 Tax=Microbacterium sp. 179-B 1A2 NHS TaxID=3142383 RepID=UPI0039A3D6D6
MATPPPFSSIVPIRQVSRPGVPSIHRFYDTSPISPSGSFVALTEFDYEDRLPEPGDSASVIVISLESGDEVYRTRTAAWDTQLGAQVQWGASDSQLFFNRIDPGEWKPRASVVDPSSGRESELAGPAYMASPDGKTLLSPDLKRIWLVQPGYGVVVPASERSAPQGAQEDDGLFATDVATGRSRLAISFAEIYEKLGESFAKIDVRRGGFFGFHVKWSPDGRRIMFIARWQEHLARRGHSKNWLLTMDANFENLRVALTPERWAGGHHPNWCPDSEHIVMNLAFPNRRLASPRVSHLLDRVARRTHLPVYRAAYTLRLARFRFDGTNIAPVATANKGSGHPTWHEPTGSVLTDAYPWEDVSNGDGTSPIRFISAQTGEAKTLMDVPTTPQYMGPRREWRVDPHPAWNRECDQFAFNGLAHGVRGVFIADMRPLLEKGIATSGGACK